MNRVNKKCLLNAFCYFSTCLCKLFYQPIYKLHIYASNPFSKPILVQLSNIYLATLISKRKRIQKLIELFSKLLLHNDFKT